MKIVRIGAFFIAIVSILSAKGQQGHRSVVLPASQAHNAERHCSRSGPKVEGGWLPTYSEIQGLEANLSKISTLKNGGFPYGTAIEHPDLSYRQYLGVVTGGKRLIYINAFLKTSGTGDWHKQYVNDVCDGGADFWGALYDPKTGQFSNLETDGSGPPPVTP